LSHRLVDLWLGPAHSAVGHLLPTVFFAFAVYYSTEALYKALEGSGLSGYSALVQTCVTAVTVSVFVAAPWGFEYATSLSLVAGLGLFSACNFLMFRFRYPRFRLLTVPQIIALTLPAACFVGAVVMKPEWAPGNVALYFFVHAWATRQTGVIDFISVAKQCIRIARPVRPAA